MEIKTIKEVLENLESKYHSREGYATSQILNELHLKANRENEKLLRAKLRSMMSKNLYPEFATAGSEDVVYSPRGKGSGLYRLSKYRG